MTRSKQWTLGTALAVVLVLAAGFMLLVQPKRSEASDLKAQTLSQEESAATLQNKLSQLKAQQKDLPRQQAKLTEIRTRLPETPALPSLIRSLTVAADTAGAEIISLAPSAPVDLAPAAAQGAAAGSVQAGGVASAAPAVAAGALKQIPLQITVGGSYAALTQLLTQLEGLQRSMLITDITLKLDDATEAEAGALQMTLGAAVFMTAEQAAAAQAIVPTQAPAPSADSSATTQ